MILAFNMEDAIKVADKEGISAEEIVKINQNLVTVKLRGKEGYDYSFFNDVNAKSNFDTSTSKGYFIVINSK